MTFVGTFSPMNPWRRADAPFVISSFVAILSLSLSAAPVNDITLAIRPLVARLHYRGSYSGGVCFSIRLHETIVQATRYQKGEALSPKANLILELLDNQPLCLLQVLSRHAVVPRLQPALRVLASVPPIRSA